MKPEQAQAIKQEIALGYISEQRHPSAPLRILNYTQRAQYEWRWNPETVKCRGLIVDDKWNVVARPFPKFFSFEQLNGDIPNEPFDVYEKLDGSLGILYHVDDIPMIATRGSFTSEQAVRATQIYQEKYCRVKVDKAMTYLFEIIYPENRIVVDYGQQEDLILLAVIETATGKESSSLPEIGFPVVKQYRGFRQFSELAVSEEGNREGYVVRFASGQRVKIKFEEYKRVHKLVTGLSPKSVWEHLRSGKNFAELIEQVPDEFFAWVKDIEQYLRRAFESIESACQMELDLILKQMPGATRKDLANRINQGMYPSVLFAMLDRQDYADRVWKLIAPKGQPQVFRRGGD